MSLATLDDSDGSHPVQGPIAPADWAALNEAVDLLERSSFARALSNGLGKQIKAATSMVPARMGSIVSRAVSLALQAALKAAIQSLGPSHGEPRSSDAGTASIFAHRAAAAASGAAGGAFGFATLPIELPVSTTLILRSIAKIARSEGEDLSTPEGALACIEVFALGGAEEVEPWESGYFAVRAVLAQATGAATRYLLHHGAIEEGAPALARLASVIAARFGAAVTQKAAAQAIPFIGAVGGAAVNYIFMQHFQRLARGHFTLRRLERAYGPVAIKQAYEQIMLARAGDRAKGAPVAQSLVET